MAEHSSDEGVLKHIGRLVEEEHALHAGGTLTDRERERLGRLTVELDQCWYLLDRKSTRLNSSHRL